MGVEVGVWTQEVASPWRARAFIGALGEGASGRGGEGARRWARAGTGGGMPHDAAHPLLATRITRALSPRSHPICLWRWLCALLQVVSEHIETDVRVRLGIAPADQEWRDEQCPREWFPEKRPCALPPRPPAPASLVARAPLPARRVRVRPCARASSVCRCIIAHCRSRSRLPSPTPPRAAVLRSLRAMIKHMAKVRARLKR